MKIIIDTDNGKVLSPGIGIKETSAFKTLDAFIKEVEAQPKANAGALNSPKVDLSAPSNANSIREDVLTRQKQTIQAQIDRLKSQIDTLDQNLQHSVLHADKAKSVKHTPGRTAPHKKGKK